jgi:hypothetical protein
MNIIKIATAALLALCSLHLSAAQDREGPGDSAPSFSPVATERSAEAYAVALPPRPAATAAAAAATGNSEVFQNIVIAAGRNATINSTLDYSSANTVAVTVLCAICTTAATSLGTSGLVLQASWLVPNASSYAVAENKAATTFPYWDAGAALFNTYGSQFRLILQNTGTQTVAIQQVTLFRRSQ